MWPENVDSCAKEHSFVCSGGRKAVWKAKFLPPGAKLHPNNEDLHKLRKCIHLRLGPKALMKTRLSTNTQKNESVNRTLTKTNPKFGTWRRTLPGQIHGGVSSSIQSRCKAVGTEIHSSLVKRQLKNIQNKWLPCDKKKFDQIQGKTSNSATCTIQRSRNYHGKG